LLIIITFSFFYGIYGHCYDDTLLEIPVIGSFCNLYHLIKDVINIFSSDAELSDGIADQKGANFRKNEL